MLKLIIVDDEQLITDGLVRLVDWDELGVEIVGEASNGFEALKLIHELQPQILICDVKMPGMDGIELLKVLRDENNKIKTIILSGYDNFHYIKAAMKYDIENYLLKPVNKDELISTFLNVFDKIDKEKNSKLLLAESLDVLKNNVLNRLITNRISRDELKDKLKYLGLDLTGITYRTVVVEVLNLDSQEDSIELSQKSYSILKMIDMIIKSKSRGITFFNNSGRVTVILINSIDRIGIINEIFSKCMDNIKLHTGVDVLITVGSAVDSYEKIHFSYNEAVKLMDYKYVVTKSRVIIYSNEASGIILDKTPIEFDIGELENFLTTCNINGANTLIERLYEIIMTKKSLNPVYVQNYLIELIVFLIGLIKNYRLNVDKIVPDRDNIAGIIKCETARELIDNIKNICEGIVFFLNEKKQNNKESIDKIIEYVNDHYHEDLSLKTLSAKFNFSSAYLGQIFKNEVNEIFTDYLNNIRIRKAKELILCTRKSLSEIALAIGYTDSNYFYKIFKKYTGIYPSQFKLKE